VIHLAADHNFNENILTALATLSADAKVIRVREVGLALAEDPAILQWTADRGLVLLSHDRKTMIGYAHERVAAGLPMPGLVIVRERTSVGQIAEDLLILIECSLEGELEGQVRYVPL
jgi:hypothetical protein